MSDIVEVSTALLKRFMEFTKKLTPEELGAIASGDLKFVLETKAKPNPGSTNLDVAAISAALSKIDSRDEAASYIDRLRLTAPQQKELAKELGASLTGVSTKPQVRDRIVEHCVGYRLNSQTVRSGSW